MNIIEALKTENLRIDNGDKWLFYDEISKFWVVMKKAHRARINKILIQTESEEEAVKILLEE